MTTITTLAQFLSLAGTQFQVYDLGRRVVPLSAQQFNQFENGESPYPFPRSGHAWIGLLFWDPKASTQHYVWFLKLPLDEQGKINPAARSQFLQLVMEALGSNVTGELSEDQQQRLGSNPFVFTPSQEKMAVFNSRVKMTLAQPASVYMEAVQDYFSGQLGWDNWQQLGLQGIADLCCRMTKQDQQNIAAAIPQLPLPALTALVNSAEHFGFENQVDQAWLARARQATSELEKITAIRGLAGSEQLPQAVTELLQQPLTADALIVIAARLWHGLNESNINLWLEQLAQYPGEVFNQLHLDLVAQPSLREPILQAMRNPQRSQALSEALGQLMTLLRG